MLARGKVMQRDADGQALRVLGVTSDITARKQAEWALRESESLFRRLADTAPVMIWMANADHQVTYVNRTWLEFTGRALDQELGDGWVDTLHPDDRGEVDICVQAFKDGRPFRIEYRMRRRDGAWRWVMDVGVPRYDELGGMIGFIGSCADITDQKQAEEALRTHRDRLSRQVQEQIRDLGLAKDEAERANAAKSMFLANMSHELRTPMHAILSYAKLGETRAERAAPEKLQEFFARIRVSGDRLLILLNDLLDLSKLEAGRMVMDIEPMDFAQVVRDAMHEFEALYLSRGVALATDVDPALPRIHADRARLGQVVRNLLSNAAKFTPQGRAVTIRLDRVGMRDRRRGGHEDIDAVRLLVSDQGVGIPEDELEAVFDAFVQSSKTRTGAGGTGLGLSISREIVHALGGHIRALKNADGGADFEVTLPAVEEARALVELNDSGCIGGRMEKGQPDA
jgi:PAS domain S-box-containing protein